MAIEVRPATVFDDVRTMVGPKRPDASVCWCLTYRIPSKENVSLRGPARGARITELMERGPIGVLAYDGDDVVGWAAVAPRAETTFTRNGQKVDLTMAYVGTRALFEKAGFHKAADTSSVINGFPRVLMRLDLR
jgi:hypothetical protein